MSTRLEPSGACILIQTRWTSDDLVARLQEGESAGEFEFINLPALAQEDDILGRAPGEALWSRWPIELLEKKRLEVGATTFTTQYQGDPVPIGGRMFEPSWFEHRYDELPKFLATPSTPDRVAAEKMFGEAQRRRPLLIVQGIDSAWSTSSRADASSIATAGTDGINFYIINVEVLRAEYSDLRAAVIKSFEWMQPRMICVEEAASGWPSSRIFGGGHPHQ
jgi:hypothetical protein